MILYDYLVCGAGIAGASIACELAAHGRVLVCEQEDHPGYHTTGRSAAMYIESYGAAPIRLLTAASRAFFDAPPPGFTDHPLLTARGCLTVAGEGQSPSLAAQAREIEATGTRWREVSAAQALAMAPVLRPGAVAAGLFEPDACDIDTASLHGGYLRLARARGAEFRNRSRVERLDRAGEVWTARLSGGDVAQARVIVNAAGAWCDQVAALAGAAPLGLAPMRRTAVIIDPPAEMAIGAWPSVIDADGAWYFKPEAGRILVSPCDEIPSEPVDAAPEEIDIALCIDRLQKAADIPVTRIVRAWAGLRTFAPDRVPVIGYDPDLDGFFWCAGQGGYGMQTAPAAAQLAAARALRGPTPADIADRGVIASAYDPGRFS